MQPVLHFKAHRIPLCVPYSKTHHNLQLFAPSFSQFLTSIFSPGVTFFSSLLLSTSALSWKITPNVSQSTTNQQTLVSLCKSHSHLSILDLQTLFPQTHPLSLYLTTNFLLPYILLHSLFLPPWHTPWRIIITLLPSYMIINPKDPFTHLLLPDYCSPCQHNQEMFGYFSYHLYFSFPLTYMYKQQLVSITSFPP